MFKDNLAMLRSLHGFSKEQIAEKINIFRQTYAKEIMSLASRMSSEGH